MRFFTSILSLFLFPFICNTEDNISIFGNITKLPKCISKYLDDNWMLYKIKYNKRYVCGEESGKRAAWEINLLKIYEHNLMAEAGHYTYLLSDNELADLTTRQYIRAMVRLLPSPRLRCERESAILGAVLHDPRTIPTHFDWRKMGFNTEAINQASCGSCYAYSIALCIQAQLFKKKKQMIPLSAQQLIDCSRVTGNLGCLGGSLKNTLRYLEKALGIMAQDVYPYDGKEGQCRFQENFSVVNITSWNILPKDERALEAAVATIGPIAVSINASPKTFQLYHNGIYDDPSCASNIVNHAMLVVGYTPNEWIIKNWWGENWGENGYMRLAKNKNRCGIANYAVYINID
ncbi:hypothetical protein PV327_002806 [Microctonus hyperodae]|uniref:Uncharacterized protein n=1 Tax=Microctonus hyperodae TaxID=165561 RepID=A0AA39KPG7_MICHY|nr:hypothetical protein PV327_002806 [Microctonus hyperodae]